MLPQTPTHSELARSGSGIAVTLTMVATGLLAAYVHVGDSFGSVYGASGGMFALLLWSLFSSMALFYGAAVCPARSLSCRSPRPGRGRSRTAASRPGPG